MDDGPPGTTAVKPQAFRQADRFTRADSPYLRRVVLRFVGVALFLSAAGMWLLDGAPRAGEVLLIKLGLSIVCFFAGAVLLTSPCGRDPGQRQLPATGYRQKGSMAVQPAPGIDEMSRRLATVGVAARAHEKSRRRLRIEFRTPGCTLHMLLNGRKSVLSRPASGEAGWRWPAFLPFAPHRNRGIG
ncbi:hypothetical protein ACFMPD_12280 [Sedimentitalea sp. HM32M-2]|uniref:hypothetical protein n=1 Tax=Sedimentitalea sp. HM32M-2 TaxID=3351566 RepID=UPI003627E57A